MGGTLSSVSETENFLNNPATHRIATLKNGSKVSYSEVGPADGAPLFYIPGISGNRLVICALKDFIKDIPVRAICLDFPGYGNTTIVRDRSLEQYCDLFAGLLEVVVPDEAQKISLLGNSAGCVHISALITDERIKQRVSAAVLCSPWASVKTEGVSFVTSLMQHSPTFFSKTAAATIFLGMKALLGFTSFDKFVKGSFSEDEYEVVKKWNVSESAWSIFYDRYTQITRWDGFQETFLVCVEGNHQFNFDLNQISPQTKVMIMYGTNDGTCPHEAVEGFYVSNLKDEIRNNNFTLQQVENGTHDGLPMTKMDQVVQFIIQNSEM